MAQSYRFTELWPFAPAAEQSGSTALHKDDSAFLAWADGYTNIVYGGDVSESWRKPLQTLGKVEGNAYNVMSLGRSGQITLTFSEGISNGEGYDFAIFENSVSDDFLELAWVEVSSDGTNYVRFPNYSDTPDPVGAFGSVDAQDLWGFAGKYRQGYGTPFDLQDLQRAYDAQLAGKTDFSEQFAAQLINNYSRLDTHHITHVRILDVNGNGSALACDGYVVYDPSPTIGSAGFDLDGIGVLHQPVRKGIAQQISFLEIPNQRLADGAVRLLAGSSSGLSVHFVLESGPATINSNLVTFVGKGEVVVRAEQQGNEIYAAATPMMRSFVVSDEVQHIYVEPIANQVQSGPGYQLVALSSQGLPVAVEVSSGSSGTLVDTNTLVLTPGTELGPVELRAFQPGNDTVAPAEDLFISFDIVKAGSSNAPILFADWSALHGWPTNQLVDSDYDGVSNVEEYLLGDSAITYRVAKNEYSEPVFYFDLAVNLASMGSVALTYSTNLTDWELCVPKINKYAVSNSWGLSEGELPLSTLNGFYRLEFDTK